jgi:signal transduction histidine kinase
MRRSGWIFLAAILLPSLVLAWLAVRSARDQQVILEHQQAIISQDITDTLAKKVRDHLEGMRSDFEQTTEELVAKSSSPPALARDFNQELRQRWPFAEVGFAVGLNGTIYSPPPRQDTLARTFRQENERFLSNRENVPVFAQNSLQTFAPNSNSTANSLTPNSNATANSVVSNSQAGNTLPQQQNPTGQNSGRAEQKPDGDYKEQAQMQQAQRLVVPQKMVLPKEEALSSKILPAESDFRKVIGAAKSGVLARFLENRLRLMVWYRPQSAGSLVFGAQITQQELIKSLEPLLTSPDLQRGAGSSGSAGAQPEYCLALLDDRGKPAALSRAGFTTDWKHPLVATEIGEGLPHWEAALYLVDPKEIKRSASTLQFTLGAIVLALITAILLGGWLMAADVRRQMQLAQQKTDFVSNVSHELKTPLTSIRMFADMLAAGRVTEPERQSKYLNIISAESARLTRLINNVLDFARLERGAPAGEPAACDLVEIVREVADTCRPHLETVGATLTLEIHTQSLLVMGHRDALAQIILNLLSNAEKYGGGEILVRVERVEKPSGEEGCIEVLDRGPGVPLRQREAIFKPFRRGNDSLASGVSGSGLGLTLARRMAQAHGGTVTYASRQEGGSCFTLRVPLSQANAVQGKPE